MSTTLERRSTRQPLFPLRRSQSLFDSVRSHIDSRATGHCGSSRPQADTLRGKLDSAHNLSRRSSREVGAPRNCRAGRGQTRAERYKYRLWATSVRPKLTLRSFKPLTPSHSIIMLAAGLLIIALTGLAPFPSVQSRPTATSRDIAVRGQFPPLVSRYISPTCCLRSTSLPMVLVIQPPRLAAPWPSHDGCRVAPRRRRRRERPERER